jgi:SAM-dependent methyltransferase
VILCSHVLEHVPDDRRAMRELARVLKPDGWAFLQVPVNRRIARTIEDPQVTDPGERERRFGQSDHVRWYGLDFPVRLAEAGLEVRVEPFAERLGPEAAGRYGLVPGEDLYLCRKDSRRPSEGEARAVIR